MDTEKDQRKMYDSPKDGHLRIGGNLLNPQFLGLPMIGVSKFKAAL